MHTLNSCSTHHHTHTHACASSYICYEFCRGTKASRSVGTRYPADSAHVSVLRTRSSNASGQHARPQFLPTELRISPREDRVQRKKASQVCSVRSLLLSFFSLLSQHVYPSCATSQPNSWSVSSRSPAHNPDVRVHDTNCPPPRIANIASSQHQ